MSTNISTLFQQHLVQIKSDLSLAANTENPAIFLFKKNARTNFFYVESITRLLVKISPDKIWVKWKTEFKEIEDGLGLIDYWYAFYDFSLRNKKVPKEIKSYFQNHYLKSCLTLNHLLSENNWIWNQSLKIDKMIRKANDFEWIENEELISSTTKYYYKEIEKIESQMNENFTDIDANLHELRRSLRWLSILPQALPGYFNLKNDKASADTKKYLIPEIVNSPFNVLKIDKSIKEKIIFNKSCFLSLSWMIYMLGQYKDEGLKIEAFTTAYAKVLDLNSGEIENEMNLLLGKNHNTVSKILEDSKAITDKFHEENILENLISI